MKSRDGALEKPAHEADRGVWPRDAQLESLRKALTRRQAQHRRLAGQLRRRDQRIEELGREQARLSRALAEAQWQLDGMLASTSWRVTAPLRFMMTRLMGLRAWAGRLRSLAAWGLERAAAEGIGATARRGWTAARHHGIAALLAHAERRSAARLQPAHPMYRKAVSRPAVETMGTRVLIIAELSLPQCAKYRVRQKQELFARSGIACEVIDWRRGEEVRDGLQLHSLAIFYRVPGYPEVLELTREARRLGVISFWEVDDLIFDPEVYAASPNVQALEPALRDSLLAGVPLYRRALQACDYAIASTPELARAMVDAGAAEAFVVENALDAETLGLVRRLGLRARQPRRGRDVVLIYGSGSKAHDADFACACAAIARLMRERPHVRLRIVGELALLPELEPFRSRVETLPFTGYAEYLRLLAASDVNLAPLEDDAFNAAKSNIKFLEAAALGVPTVCSPRPAFRALIEHGRNGFLADETVDWLDALARLADDPALRARVGENARRAVLARYDPEAVAREQLAPLVARFGASPSPGAMRVLVVNVLFEPHSFGGATVVAEAMSRRLQARRDAAVSVFTSWSDPSGEAYRLIRYEAHGLPTWAVSLPPMTRDLEYDNEAMTGVFARVLAATRPDVVHFHCVQGLSASLMDACRAEDIPYVVTLHDAWWLCERQFMVRPNGSSCFQEKIEPKVCATCTGDPVFTRRRSKRLRRRLEDAALLLAPSAFQRNLYVANGFAANRVRVNGNGVRMPGPAFKRTASDVLRFAFVGGIGPAKGSELILQAFSELSHTDYELILVDNTLSMGVQSIDARRWKLPGRVRVVPAFGQAGLDEFFAGVDVLLFPSQCTESFGLTVREALVRDVWVIATDAGAATEELVDGANGTIIPIGNDHRPLRDAITGLLDAPARLSRHQNPHKHRIADYQRQAEALFGLLSAAASRPAAVATPRARQLAAGGGEQGGRATRRRHLGRGRDSEADFSRQQAEG